MFMFCSSVPVQREWDEKIEAEGTAVTRYEQSSF